MFNTGDLADKPFFYGVHRAPGDEEDSDPEDDYRTPSWQFRVERNGFPETRSQMISKFLIKTILSVTIASPTQI